MCESQDYSSEYKGSYIVVYSLDNASTLSSSVLRPSIRMECMGRARATNTVNRSTSSSLREQKEGKSGTMALSG